MPFCRSCGGEHAEGAVFCPVCGVGVAAAVAETAPAAWLADPTGRHELRYWDSQEWTNHVSDAGVASVDSTPQATAQPEPAPAEVVSRKRMSPVRKLIITVAALIIMALLFAFGGLTLWRNGLPGESLSDTDKLMRSAPLNGGSATLRTIVESTDFDAGALNVMTPGKPSEKRSIFLGYDCDYYINGEPATIDEFFDDADVEGMEDCVIVYSQDRIISMDVISIRDDAPQPEAEYTHEEGTGTLDDLLSTAPANGDDASLDIVYDNEASAFFGNYQFYASQNPDERYFMEPDNTLMLLVDDSSVSGDVFYDAICGSEPLPGVVYFGRDCVTVITVYTQEY